MEGSAPRLGIILTTGNSRSLAISGGATISRKDGDDKFTARRRRRAARVASSSSPRRRTSTARSGPTRSPRHTRRRPRTGRQAPLRPVLRRRQLGVPRPRRSAPTSRPGKKLYRRRPARLQPAALQGRRPRVRRRAAATTSPTRPTSPADAEPGHPLAARSSPVTHAKLSEDTGFLANVEALFNLNGETAPTGRHRHVRGHARERSKAELTTKLLERIDFRFNFIAKYDNAPAPLPPFTIPFDDRVRPARRQARRHHRGRDHRELPLECGGPVALADPRRRRAGRAARADEDPVELGVFAGVAPLLDTTNELGANDNDPAATSPEDRLRRSALRIGFRISPRLRLEGELALMPTTEPGRATPTSSSRLARPRRLPDPRRAGRAVRPRRHRRLDDLLGEAAVLHEDTDLVPQGGVGARIAVAELGLPARRPHPPPAVDGGHRLDGRLGGPRRALRDASAPKKPARPRAGARRRPGARSRPRTPTATASPTPPTSARTSRRTRTASRTTTAAPTPTTTATASSTRTTSVRTSRRPRTASRTPTAAPTRRRRRPRAVHRRLAGRHLRDSARRRSPRAPTGCSTPRRAS